VEDDRERHVDDLRDELRSLGYLDARVGRFVLGGANRRVPPSALAAAASARIGLLAGVLLGPAAVIGLRARAPGLVTSGRDEVVLALYLGVFFSIAAAVVTFGAILAGGLVARRAASSPEFPVRARRAAATAGLLVGLTCLVYLALWWRTALGPAGSMPVVGTSAAMAVAIAISLLLGYAVTITVLAVLARLGLGRSLTPGLPLSSRKAMATLGVVTLSSAVLLLAATAPHADDSADVATLTVVPTGARVVIVAIDGVDAVTVSRLRAAGQVPHFNAILARATAAMDSDPNRYPARVWTTIATGQPPERHGIRALESRQIAGLDGRLHPASTGWSTLTAATDLVRLTRPAIASGDQRLIPTFWEVAARAGLRTAVIHWWATWPAPDNLGIVVSDRAILRLERGGPLDAEIAPASLYDTWRQTWPARRERAQRDARSVVPPGAPPEIRSALERSAELDSTIASLAADPSLATCDLVVLYLPGLDIAQHALFGSPTGVAVAPSVAAGRVASLEQYYVFLDQLLGSSILDGGADHRLVMLVTQPGRVAPPTVGLLGISGGPRDAGTGATVTDVAPTVLYALGVPIARDLAGHPLVGLFAADFVAAHPVRDVASYGSRQPRPRSARGQPLDREMIERMRSLGYIR